jgi:hypothetical protein
MRQPLAKPRARASVALMTVRMRMTFSKRGAAAYEVVATRSVSSARTHANECTALYKVNAR